MIVTSKNGLKLVVEPNNKFNPKDWLEFFRAVKYIRTHHIMLKTGTWKMAYVSTEEVK